MEPSAADDHSSSSEAAEALGVGIESGVRQAPSSQEHGEVEEAALVTDDAPGGVGNDGSASSTPEVGSAAWRTTRTVLDRWGFELPAGGGSRGSRGLRSGGEEQVRLENSRLAKWQRMLSLSSGQLPPREQLQPATLRLLSKRVPKGVPDAVRGAVWCGLSGAQALMESRPGAYASLKRRAAADGGIPEAVAAQIENDLGRTYPDHFLWRDPAAEGAPQGEHDVGKSAGVQMLRSLLRTYALLDTQACCWLLGDATRGHACQPTLTCLPAPPPPVRAQRCRPPWGRCATARR